MKLAKYLFYIIPALFLVSSCIQDLEKITFQEQEYFYSNTQGNNTIEGDHIYISKKNGDTLYFDSNSKNIISVLSKSWVIGQGSGKPYFDTGKESLWYIKTFLKEQNAVILKPNEKELDIELPIVFWKLGPFPVHFSDSLKGSWGFSKIIQDPKDSLFKTHIYECDTNIVHIYLATSQNLNQWNIRQLLSPDDFSNIIWNVPNEHNKMTVTPLISDIIKHNGKYYSFAYGDDKLEKTYIGLLISDSLEGGYTIQPNPILSPNPNSEFSNHDVYYPKVVKFEDSWLMYYTSKNDKNEEFICVAKSSNLIDWTVFKENILPRNEGWNSGMSNLLCAQVKINNGQIQLWATGTKDVGDYSTPNKGNAMDVCIGKFYDSLPSFHLKEFPGNPVFGGNPVFEFENDHIGGAFQEIEFDGYTYTFYHGKGRNSKNYTLLVK